MKRKGFIPVFAAVAAMLTACSSEEGTISEPIQIQLTRSESDAVNAVNDFAFNLLKTIENSPTANTPNYIISPQSAAWCIAMVANGAEEDSQTLTELLDILNLGKGATIQDVNDYSLKLIEAVTSKNGSADIRVANSLYYKHSIGIYPDYVNTLKTFYSTEEFIEPTNKDLDEWISRMTGGKIQNFAEKNDFTGKCDFGVLSTLYFDGVWKKRFNPNNTKEREFRNADGTISTPMMMFEEQQGTLSSDEVCHVMKLFFNNESFAINFVIPQEGKNISDVITHLNGDNWRTFMGKTGRRNYDVMIPKLNLSSDFDLQKITEAMGLNKIYTDDNELYKLSYNKITINNFIQTALLNLDEDGVKAVAATHAGGGDTAVLLDSFILDEPFFYFITEESTGAILFAGKVSQM